MSEQLYQRLDAVQDLRRLRRALLEEGVEDVDALRTVDTRIKTILEGIDSHETNERLAATASKLAAVALAHDKDMIADDLLDLARSAALNEVEDLEGV